MRQVSVNNPHPQSQAAGVLLARWLRKEEVGQWLEFRRALLTRKLAEEGDLVCRYCGRKGLAIEVPDAVTKAEMRHLATLDHVVPRSKGGTDDESNLVVACYPCNQRKGDESVDKMMGG
jgi:5-methylcytosine-specific restriction endonuclease McrA